MSASDVSSKVSQHGTSSRSYIAATCSVLGVVALTLGVLLGYASRVLFNSEAFADRVAASLADEGVAGLVADRVTEGLISTERDLTAFAPLIAGATRSLVASEPFRGIVRRAARAGHEGMMSGRAQRMMLNLSDIGVILHSALSTNPELAKKIPPQITAMVGDSDEVPGGQMAIDFLRLARRSRLSALALIILGVGLCVLGIVLSPARRISLFRLGLSLAIIALVLRLTVRFGGEILALLARDAAIGQAAAGMWHAFLGGFMTWALVLGAIGLVLAAAVNSLFERVQVEEMARAVWQWLTTTPATTGSWLLHGAVLLLMGGLISLAPNAALTIVAFLAGLLIFFIGLREVFRLLLRFLPQVEAHRAAAASARGNCAVLRT